MGARRESVMDWEVLGLMMRNLMLMGAICLGVWVGGWRVRGRWVVAVTLVGLVVWG